MTASRVMIIGGDGLIEGSLADRLLTLGRNVMVTTRRSEPKHASGLVLDLSLPPDTWPTMPDADAWVICAGTTKAAQCHADPEGSRLINVEATAALARNAKAAGAQVLFLSTNQVFDGSTRRRPANDTPCPITEYGRQKADAECLILEMQPRSAVIRLTKVLDTGFDLLNGWIQDLCQGRVVEAFSDMVMAPVPLDTTADILVAVMDRRLGGILQVSGPKDISYSDAAMHLAQRLGADLELVRPASAAGAGLPPEETPRHTTLIPASTE